MSTRGGEDNLEKFKNRLSSTRGKIVEKVNLYTVKT
jgi:hypothetical protein